MQTVRFDPRQGQAYQGDIVIMPVPPGIELACKRENEIPLKDGMLVLAEGEVTGHHHAIRFVETRALERAFDKAGLSGRHDPSAGTEGATLGGLASTPMVTAKMYRDQDALNQMVRKGYLTTDELCVGFLEIGPGAPPVTHDEHGAIVVPPGQYYVGRKREMDAGEIRRVAD